MSNRSYECFAIVDLLYAAAVAMSWQIWRGLGMAEEQENDVSLRPAAKSGSVILA